MSKKSNSTSSIFAVLQRIGKSFMFPIALLPVAGLLLGVGSSFTNESTLLAYNLMEVMGPGTITYDILSICSDVGNIIFSNLPILFTMGVAIGMANTEKAIACLSSVIAYLAMSQTINTMLRITGSLVNDGYDNWVASESLLSGSTTQTLGITSLQTGVFGGIVVGLIVAALHNKFYKIELPSVISFFGGVRFIPIISVITSIPLGILMFFLWPYVQNGIYSLGDFVNNAGYAGTFAFGFIERALIPFGLHHVFVLPFWQTGVGGSMVINGVTVEGALNIFFAQLADPNTTSFSVDATKFMAGKFPFMMFGLPGAALAMYTCAKTTKRKIVGGLLLSAALTAIITGITEPIEFSFLFAAPFLYYGIHCILAGASFMLMHMLKVGVGLTFSGGLIDLTLFGILQGNSRTNWIYIVLVGIVYFFIYFFIFRFLIKKFDLKTPGRENNNLDETKLYTNSDYQAKKESAKKTENEEKNEDKEDENISDSEYDQVKLILEALGGKDNLINLDSCATRLRITVVNADLVDDDKLKSSGAIAVIKRGEGVQIVYGPVVTVIKSKLEDYIDKL